MSLPLNFGSLVLIQEGAASHAGGIQISYDGSLGADVSAAVQGDVYVITFGPGCTLGTLMKFIDDDPNLPETTVLLDTGEITSAKLDQMEMVVALGVDPTPVEFYKTADDVLADNALNIDLSQQSQHIGFGLGEWGEVAAAPWTDDPASNATPGTAEVRFIVDPREIATTTGMGLHATGGMISLFVKNGDSAGITGDSGHNIAFAFDETIGTGGSVTVTSDSNSINVVYGPEVTLADLFEAWTNSVGGADSASWQSAVPLADGFSYPVAEFHPDASHSNYFLSHKMGLDHGVDPDGFFYGFTTASIGDPLQAQIYSTTSFIMPYAGTDPREVRWDVEATLSGAVYAAGTLSLKAGVAQSGKVVDISYDSTLSDLGVSITETNTHIQVTYGRNTLLGLLMEAWDQEFSEESRYIVGGSYQTTTQVKALSQMGGLLQRPAMDTPYAYAPGVSGWEHTFPATTVKSDWTSATPPNPINATVSVIAQEDYRAFRWSLPLSAEIDAAGGPGTVASPVLHLKAPADLSGAVVAAITYDSGLGTNTVAVSLVGVEYTVTYGPGTTISSLMLQWDNEVVTGMGFSESYYQSSEGAYHTTTQMTSQAALDGPLQQLPTETALGWEMSFPDAGSSTPAEIEGGTAPSPTQGTVVVTAATGTVDAGVFPYAPDTHVVQGGLTWDTADLNSWGPWEVDMNIMLPNDHADYGTLPVLQLYLFMPGSIASNALFALTRSGKAFNLLPPVNGEAPKMAFMGQQNNWGQDYDLYGYGYSARLADLNKSVSDNSAMMWVIKGPDGQLYRPETLPDDLNMFLHYPSGIGFSGWRLEFTVKDRNSAGGTPSWQEIITNAVSTSATMVVEDAPQVYRWEVVPNSTAASPDVIGKLEVYRYVAQSQFASAANAPTGLHPIYDTVVPVFNKDVAPGTIYIGRDFTVTPNAGENVIIVEYGPDTTMQAFVQFFNLQTPNDLFATWVNDSDLGPNPGDDFPMDQFYEQGVGSFEGQQPKAYALSFEGFEVLSGANSFTWVDQDNPAAETATWVDTYSTNADGTARFTASGMHWVQNGSSASPRSHAASAYAAAPELVASWTLPRFDQSALEDAGFSGLAISRLLDGDAANMPLAGVDRQLELFVPPLLKQGSAHNDGPTRDFSNAEISITYDPSLNDGTVEITGDTDSTGFGITYGPFTEIYSVMEAWDTEIAVRLETAATQLQQDGALDIYRGSYTYPYSRASLLGQTPTNPNQTLDTWVDHSELSDAQQAGTGGKRYLAQPALHDMGGYQINFPSTTVSSRISGSDWAWQTNPAGPASNVTATSNVLQDWTDAVVQPVVQWDILSESGDVQGTLKIMCRNPDLNGMNFVDEYPNGFEIHYGGQGSAAYSASRQIDAGSGVDKYEILYGSDLTMSQLIDQINNDASLQTIYEASTPAASHPGLTPNYYATWEWAAADNTSLPDFTLFDPNRPPSAGDGDVGGALYFTRREFWGDLNAPVTITWNSVG